MEIPFFSCHVSIKKTRPCMAFWRKNREKASPSPDGRAASTFGRHQISKIAHPGRRTRFELSNENAVSNGKKSIL
jgi:hypothetical protein